MSRCLYKIKEQTPENKLMTDFHRSDISWFAVCLQIISTHEYLQKCESNLNAEHGKHKPFVHGSPREADRTDTACVWTSRPSVIGSLNRTRVSVMMVFRTFIRDWYIFVNFWDYWMFWKRINVVWNISGSVWIFSMLTLTEVVMSSCDLRRCCWTGSISGQFRTSKRCYCRDLHFS